MGYLVPRQNLILDDLRAQRAAGKLPPRDEAIAVNVGGEYAAAILRGGINYRHGRCTEGLLDKLEGIEQPVGFVVGAGFEQEGR